MVSYEIIHRLRIISFLLNDRVNELIGFGMIEKDDLV